VTLGIEAGPPTMKGTSKTARVALAAGGVLWLVAGPSCISGPDQALREPVRFQYDHALVEAIEKGNASAVRKALREGLDADATNSNGTTALWWAAWHGQKEIVRLLVDEGARLDVVPGERRSPLLAAALEGHEEVARLLVERGAPLEAPAAAALGLVDRLGQMVSADPALLVKRWDAQDGHGQSLVDFAALHGQREALALLAQRGADLNAADGEGWNALLKAAWKGQLDGVRALVDLGADVNRTAPYGWTPLRGAARYGHREVAEFLLRHGATYDIFSAASLGDVRAVEHSLANEPGLVHARAGPEWTPLLWAAAAKKPAAVKALLAYGANVSAVGSYFGSALNQAAWDGDREMVELLLAHEADTETGAGTEAYGTPLHAATWQDHTEIIAILLRHGAKIDSVNNQGETPLHFAAGQGHKRATRLLLQHGVPVNAPAKGGHTALTDAAWEGHTAIARLLLEAGADVNAGKPLCAAAHKGCPDLVDLLLRYKPDLKVRSEDGKAPLHWAVEVRDSRRASDYLRIVDRLLACGAGVEERSYAGYTVLHRAIYHRAPLAMVLKVIRAGADISARNDYGQTALHIACQARQPDVVHLLLSRGADPNVQDRNGCTPLHLVTGEKDERDENASRIAALLRTFGAEDDIFAYALRGDCEKVEALLRAHPEWANQKGASGGRGLLHIAASRGDLTMMKTLLGHGADVELLDNSGRWTPLHYAAFAGRLEALELLLEHGAKVNVPGLYNQGPLHTAASAGHLEIIRRLVAAGADVNALTTWGYSPLDNAIGGRHPEVAEVLRAAGGQPNKRNP